MGDGMADQRQPVAKVHWSEPVLLVIVSALTFAELRTPLNVYDEGLVLTAGLRLLAGEAPYVDFWRAYPPGEFLLAAGIQALGSDSVLAHRVVDVLMRIGVIVVAWAIARRLMGLGARVLLVVGVGVAMAAVNSHYLYPVYPSLLMVLVCYWSALRASEVRDGRWRVGVAAAALVVAALFRLDVAAYGGVSLLLAGLWARHRGVSPGLSRRVLQVVGVAAISGVVLGSGLLFWVTPQAAWDSLVAFPATGMRAARGLPLPALWHVSFATTSGWMAWYPLLVVVVIAVVAVIAALRARGDGALPLTVALLCFSIGLLLLALSRPDRSHSLPSLLIGFMVVLACLSGARTRALRAVSLIAVWGVVVLQFGVALRTMVPDLMAYPLWAPCGKAPARATCVAVENDQTDAVAYIRGVTAPGERIFVGDDRHDRIFIGDSSFYYLADRLPATKYDEMHPGVVDQAATQSRIIQDIRSVRYVVLWNAPDSTEPNASSVGTGVTLLDDYLRTHYEMVYAASNYRILLRTGAP